MIKKEELTAKFDIEEVPVELIKEILASDECLNGCKMRCWDALSGIVISVPTSQIMLVIGEVASRGYDGLISAH